MRSITNSEAKLESMTSEIRRCWCRSRLAGQVSRSQEASFSMFWGYIVPRTGRLTTRERTTLLGTM